MIIESFRINAKKMTVNTVNFDDFKSISEDINSLQKQSQLIQGRCLYNFLSKISWPLNWMPAICFYIFLISILDHLFIPQGFRDFAKDFNSSNNLIQFAMGFLSYLLGVSDVAMSFLKYAYSSSSSVLIITIGLLFLGKNLKYFKNS